MSDTLNTPLRHDEEWIAKRLRELGIYAEVTNYMDDVTDGMIIVGKCEQGELSVQVGNDYVVLTAHAENSAYHFPGEYSTIQELAMAIKVKINP